MPISNPLKYRHKNLEPEFFGLDTEASATGTEHTRTDIHTVQVCSNRGESTGRIFYTPEAFKEWYANKKPRPKIFFAFTLPFEYGSLCAWELLKASTEDGRYPWQAWADEPINLFYIQIDNTRIPVFDIRIFFHQLQYEHQFLSNLKALGHYLSEYYKQDIHKLPAPLGNDFGKRAPTAQERPYFEKYGVRDAFINAMAAEWVHTNILNNWLEGKIPITRLYSWGTIAKHFFNMPKIGEAKNYGKTRTLIFPNMWHQRIFQATFAGRAEAFTTGNVGQTYYSDVSSLYPTSIIATQCLLIKNVTQWHGPQDQLLGKITWQNFYEHTGYPYGWLLGDFKTDSDIWALPLKIGNNNIYVTGKVKHTLYSTLDLEASHAEALDIQAVLIPEYSTDPAFINPMKKYEQLTQIKISGHYQSEVEKHCIKSTLNAASGTLGKSHPTFGPTTNLPAYNTMLAQSHLLMSQIFQMYHTPQHPVHYCDTDSLFWHEPIEKTIKECQPYPTLPFQILQTLPLKLDVKGTSRPEGCVIFRGKMYFENENSKAFSAWKPFPKYFSQIINARTTEATVERQICRKWQTRDTKAITLKIGRWFIKKEHWNLDKLKQIFRADPKRCRATYDSYQLFLEGKSQTSQAWTAQQAINKLAETPWKIEHA